jgi:hypothetical protein
MLRSTRLGAPESSLACLDQGLGELYLFAAVWPLNGPQSLAQVPCWRNPSTFGGPIRRRARV